MRRALPGVGLSLRGRLVVLLAFLAAASFGAALVGSRARADSDYRVDVIFDTAKGIIPGQLVKIAGARAGLIDDIVLTPDYKARIQMTVDSKFAPFRSNARCDIQAEGLIAERFVQCDPGTAAAPPLTGKAGKPPTVPVTRTFVPVSFTDLFNIWRLPVRQRLSLFIAGAGLGLAGRGDDLNDVLRRSNPTLALIRQAVTILNRQRQQIAAAIADTDRVAAALAPRSARVSSFIDHAARVTGQAADHRTELAEAVRRLPGLLAAARPALRRLDTLASSGRPVLSDLRAAAPDLERVVRRLTPFSRAGVPALRDLGSALSFARPEIRRLRPLIGQLRTFAREGLPTGQLVEQLFTSLRDRGFVEGLLSFVYTVSAVLARYDDTSHIIPVHALTNGCTPYADAPVAGCSANYAPAASMPRTRADRKAQPRRTPVAPPASSSPQPVPVAPPEKKPPAIRLPGLPPIQLPSVPRLPKLDGGALSTRRSDRGSPLDNLLNYLLG